MFVVLTLAYSWFFSIVALLFGVVTYLLWSHASGRLKQRVWQKKVSKRQEYNTVTGEFRTDKRRTRQYSTFSADPSLSEAEAYRRLELTPDADQDQVKAAYRERVKQVHPDRNSGNEREFKAVTAAYERLTE
ncbi:MAG: DnaJ-class molecular chaperone with C-terminal Zn finger domain protein [Haloquadratum sp. J07HQX50]|nr:MAG: DnaJ-class molecular chaperone with C-terminal Zn finger domain protein [Haloquadratum sp. J07HQX50]